MEQDALAISRSGKIDATARTVVLVALVVDASLRVGGAAFVTWTSVALGALVLVALRERPASPSA